MKIDINDISVWREALQSGIELRKKSQAEATNNVCKEADQNIINKMQSKLDKLDKFFDKNWMKIAV